MLRGRTEDGGQDIFEEKGARREHIGRLRAKCYSEGTAAECDFGLAEGDER